MNFSASLARVEAIQPANPEGNVDGWACLNMRRALGFSLYVGMEEDIILLAGKNIHDKRTVAWSKDQLRDWADRFKAARDDAGLDAGVAAAVREARLQMTKMDPGAFESQCRANRRRLEAWLSTQVHLAMYRSDGDKES